MYGYGLQRVFLIDNKNGWAVGDGGMIWYTSDGGKNWNEQVQGWPTNKLLKDIHFTDKLTGWTVGWEGALFRTADGGENWTFIDLGTDESLYDIHFTDHYHGWIVGSNGTIYRTTDGGGFPQTIEHNIKQNNKHNIITNYPNPFHTKTNIEYSIKEKSHVLLDIYNLQGKKVSTLVEGNKQTGLYKTVWEGDGLNGSEVSTGVYYLVLTTSNNEKITRVKKEVFFLKH